MNLTQSSEYNVSLFENRLSESSLSQVISIAVLSSNKIKLNALGLCGKVYRTTDLIKQAISVKLSSIPDFIIVINEEIFDRLESEHQLIIVDKLLSQIGFDYEKGNTFLNSPDVQEFSSMLKKYDFNNLESLKIHVESLYEKLQEDAQNAAPKKKFKKKN